MSDERPSDEEHTRPRTGARSVSGCAASGGRSGLSLQDVEAKPRRRSSRRPCSAPTNAASGPSRCPGSSGWRASTTCRSTSSCLPTRAPTSPGDPGHRPHRSTGRAGPDKITIDLDRLDELRAARRRHARPLPLDDPGAAAGLQRPHAHDPRDDLRAIACILDVEADQAAARLDDLGLRRRGPDPVCAVRRLRAHPVLCAAVRLLRAQTVRSNSVSSRVMMPSWPITATTPATSRSLSAGWSSSRRGQPASRSRTPRVGATYSLEVPPGRTAPARRRRPGRPPPGWGCRRRPASRAA